MRPLFHPAIEDVTVESILHALSDPTRVAIFANIVGASSAGSCTSFCSTIEKEIPKSTLSQHFKILREGGLIRSERQGVEMLNTSRCAEIEKRFPGLLPAIVNAHKAQVAAAARKPAKRPRAAKAGP
jgi:DNA-binding transcriptional ArsR family regulator